MSELKTLKDIEAKKFGNSIYAHYSEKKLKYEAIKWIKDEDSQTLDSTDAWIKHFFNITEEDLK